MLRACMQEHLLECLGLPIGCIKGCYGTPHKVFTVTTQGVLPHLYECIYYAYIFNGERMLYVYIEVHNNINIAKLTKGIKQTDIRTNT